MSSKSIVATKEPWNDQTALELPGIHELMEIANEVFSLRQGFTLRTNVWGWIQTEQDWRNKGKGKKSELKEKLKRAGRSQNLWDNFGETLIYAHLSGVQGKKIKSLFFRFVYLIAAILVSERWCHTHLWGKGN